MGAFTEPENASMPFLHTNRCVRRQPKPAEEKIKAGDGESENVPAHAAVAEESKMAVDDGDEGGSQAAAAATAPPNPVSGPGVGGGSGATATASVALPSDGTSGRGVGGEGGEDKAEWVAIPAPEIQSDRLRLLCSVLRLEACSDSSFLVSHGGRFLSYSGVHALAHASMNLLLWVRPGCNGYDHRCIAPEVLVKH